jgi:hypothetical protein
VFAMMNVGGCWILEDYGMYVMDYDGL